MTSDPALDVLHRALAGDHAALSFLDRTSSIYVLDATDPAKPKTYGGWNFIHQAMNEIERREAALSQQHGHPAALTSHAQLLTTIAERVARRSPAADKSLISTCIANASQYQGGPAEANGLITLNSEIREIVMGRIAAMAFDYSFHNRNRVTVSAFSNPVAMEKLCSVLAANAVSSGPGAINHFMCEWIIPSARSLPPFAVVCVIYHLGIEALQSTAPVGTRDRLQQLSSRVIGLVLAPVLYDAVMEESDSALSNHEANARVAATALRALERWCTATDISLPQMKHICSKVRVDIIALISDALYSDSELVVEALAELFEVCLKRRETGRISDQRMTQARHIMEVDEEAFRSISREDIFRIECKEMNEALGELVTAVGLQRFRFTERQSSGDDGVCRNLTRIAGAVGSASIDGLVSGQIQVPSSGLLELLMKATSHPLIHICSTALDVLVRLMTVDHTFPPRILPLLQHRAIIPYKLVGLAPTLNTIESGGVDFVEYMSFRENSLGDALVECFKQRRKYYMDSCASAVEEFCDSSSTVEVSFQLEAALFCLNAVAFEVTSSIAKENLPLNGSPPASNEFDQQLLQCVNALAKKPSCLAANPLALAQLNRYLGMYARWFGQKGSNRALDVASELALSTIAMAGSAFQQGEPAADMLKEMQVSPFSEASKSIHCLLVRNPAHFTSQQAIASLAATWEATYTSANRGSLTVEDRVEICSGICRVLTTLSPTAQDKPYYAFCLPTIECVKSMAKRADDQCGQGQQDQALRAVLKRMADEIKVLSTLVKALAEIDRPIPSSPTKTGTENDASKVSVFLLKEVWPCLTHVGGKYASFNDLSRAIGTLLSQCAPREVEDENSVSILKELSSLANLLLTAQSRDTVALVVVLDFVDHLVSRHGEKVETAAQGILGGPHRHTVSPSVEETGKLLEKLIVDSVQVKKDTLGIAWTRDKEQGQGQRPFESKAEPVSEEATSKEALSAIFSLLNSCCRYCPTFLVHLPASPNVDRDYDRLLNRAIESAVSSISDSDVEVARQAILFLKAVMEILESAQMREIRAVVEAVVSGVCQTIVRDLVAGICGSLNATVVDPAASLLHTVLRGMPDHEAQSAINAAVQQDLVRNGRTVIQSCLTRCVAGQILPTDLMDFAEELWELHQASGNDNTESDTVAEFVQRYSSG